MASMVLLQVEESSLMLLEIAVENVSENILLRLTTYSLVWYISLIKFITHTHIL